MATYVATYLCSDGTNRIYNLLCSYVSSIVPMISVVNSPASAGTPVNGSTNTYDYAILSNVSLTCMVDPLPVISVSYRWNTTQCYNNINFNNGIPGCFPHNQTTQNVTGNGVTAEDAGTITCTMTLDGIGYTSEPFTLRISGK